MFLIGLDQFFRRYFDTKIHDLVSVVFEDNLDEILADVVDVALDRGKDHLAALGGTRTFHELFEVTHRSFHDLGGLQHLGDDQFVGVEEAAYLGHAGHQRAVNDVQGRGALRAFAFEVRDQTITRAFQDVICEAFVEWQISAASFFFFLGAAEMLGDGGNPELIDGSSLFLALLTPVRGSIEQQARVRMIWQHALGRMRKQQIFSEFALVGGNRRKALDLLGVDNRQVQTSFGAVVEENGVQHFARARRQPEGNIRNAEDGAHVGQSLLDQANAFHGFNGATDVVVIAGSAGKDQRVEDDILWSHIVVFRKQLVGALGDGQLAFARERLRLNRVFIDAPDDHGGAVFTRNRHGSLELFLAIFEVDGIDDGLALAIGESQLDGHRVGGINHDWRLHFVNQLFVERRDVFLLVALGALQAHVHDLRAAAHLPPCNFAGLLPLFFGHEILEQPRANHVGALADKQRARAFFRFDGLDACINGAMGFRGTLPRPLAVRHPRDRANVPLRRAAAAADEVQPSMIHKFLELRCK